VEAALKYAKKMRRIEPYQHIKKDKRQFQLVVRRFARWKHFSGYEGDSRSFSTSRFTTYRTGMFVVFDLDEGSITEGPIGNSTGTRQEGATSEPRTYAKIHTRLTTIENDEGSISFKVKFWGKNPAPTLLAWKSPNIDTSIYFSASMLDGNLFSAGVLSGDAFPDAEVFIRDNQLNGQMLLRFSTPHGKTAGPIIRLPGKGTRFLGSFKTGITLDERGSFIGSRRWGG